MRFMLMRSLLFSLVVLAWALPTAAQLQYVKAPISIENAVLTQPGEPEGTPVAVPVAEVVIPPSGCPSGASGFIELEVVQDAIELNYDVTVPDGCSFVAMLNFDVVLEVPVLGTESAAFVYLIAAAGPANFSILNNSPGIHVTFKALRGGSSAQVEEPFATVFGDRRHRWYDIPTEMSTLGSDPVSVQTMFPGDTVRVPVELVIDATNQTDGSLSTNYEFRTRFPIPAPEPSAALSLPIGVLGLAGLAAMKGGV
jgi:hypothetical protein